MGINMSLFAAARHSTYSLFPIHKIHNMPKVKLLLLTTLTITAFAADGPPKHGKLTPLFDGSNLDNFDIVYRNVGVTADTDHIFPVENGTVHVSGKKFGYFITKKEYSDYYLRAEFKWGQGTYEPKLGKARDSGILYHCVGEQKVWPRSIELQIQEGGTGDIWLTDGAALTGKDGKPMVGPPGKAVRIDRFNKGPWKDVTDYRDPQVEVEKPHGQWNVVELVVKGDHVWHFVNGKLVNEGTQANPASGKILFQSEGAEIFFRKIYIAPLKGSS
jgi:hypothetical protein